MLEYRIGWTTLGGGTGASVFHLNESGTPVPSQVNTAFRDWCTAQAALIPSDVTWDFPSEMRQFDAQDGVLTGVLVIPAPGAPISGSGASGYNRAAGYRVDWITQGIVAGRRVRGRTYQVPSLGSVFDADGQVVGSVLTTVQTAANDLIADLSVAGVELVVWSRPFAGSLTIDPREGSIHDVVSASPSPFGAILRGRRD